MLCLKPPLWKCISIASILHHTSQTKPFQNISHAYQNLASCKECCTILLKVIMPHHYKMWYIFYQSCYFCETNTVLSATEAVEKNPATAFLHVLQGVLHLQEALIYNSSFPRSAAFPGECYTFKEIMHCVYENGYTLTCNVNCNSSRCIIHSQACCFFQCILHYVIL